MSTQQIVVAAVAIPVISFFALKITTRLARLVGKMWRWLMHQMGAQAAEAVDALISPRLNAMHSEIMGSVEQLKLTNERDHTEVQKRLGGVETRLKEVEVRLLAVETQLTKENHESSS